MSGRYRSEPDGNNKLVIQPFDRNNIKAFLQKQPAGVILLMFSPTPAIVAGNFPAMKVTSLPDDPNRTLVYGAAAPAGTGFIINLFIGP